MKGLRRLLVKMLGVEKYLFFISNIYIKLISWNFLKKKYPEIHFLKQIVQPDYVCVDIGANLGYYTTVLSRTASKGKVFGVEPIPLFVKIWTKNTRRCKNVSMFSIALGSEKQEVDMRIPIVDGLVRHGLSQVVENSEVQGGNELAFKVQMDVGDVVFADFEKIDFIKCDIEGYERYAISSMLDTIKKHRPIIQIELVGDENRKEVYEALKGLDFETFILKNGSLELIEEERLLSYGQDFYFVAKEKMGSYSFL